MKVNELLAGKMLTYQKLEKGTKADFQKIILEKLKEVDQKEKEAEQALLSLAKGEEIDPAEVAQKISTADVSMKLLLRVRNKVLEAYQEIMRMQI
ncbi:MAG: flagellar hook-basal body complex protein FliE [Caldimicrobium sp.]